jgi:hypothetical protein
MCSIIVREFEVKRFSSKTDKIAEFAEMLRIHFHKIRSFPKILRETTSKSIDI